MTNITFCLSTIGEFNYFWGIKKKINVYDNEKLRTKDDILKEFFLYLEVLCDQIPILKENIKHLRVKINSCTCLDNFEDKILKIIENEEKNDIKETFYICDHSHIS